MGLVGVESVERDPTRRPGGSASTTGESGHGQGGHPPQESP